MHKNHRNLSEKNQLSSGLRFLLWNVMLLLVLLLAFGIYSVVRRTAQRFSADYYFPFLKAVRGIENTIADQSLLTLSKPTLAGALRNLMKENAVLAAERTVVSDLKKENAELRSLLKLGRKGSFHPVFAEVLSRSPMTWQEEFTIDKGQKDGIEPGNPVVVSIFSAGENTPAAAVIGKIKSVSAHSAQVSTVLSQDFRLSVSLPETKSAGILEGARNISEPYAILKFLPQNAAPAAGQLVCTNSFSGNRPPGLPIGRILHAEATSGKTARNQLYLEANVRPFESPAEVRFVAVFVKERK